MINVRKVWENPKALHDISHTALYKALLYHNRSSVEEIIEYLLRCCNVSRANDLVYARECALKAGYYAETGKCMPDDVPEDVKRAARNLILVQIKRDKELTHYRFEHPSGCGFIVITCHRGGDECIVSKVRGLKLERNEYVCTGYIPALLDGAYYILQMARGKR